MEIFFFLSKCDAYDEPIAPKYFSIIIVKQKSYQEKKKNNKNNKPRLKEKIVTGIINMKTLFHILFLIL